MRVIQLAVHQEDVQRVTVTVASDVAFQILNDKRAALNQIEAETEKQIIIRGDPAFTSDEIQFEEPTDDPDQPGTGDDPTCLVVIEGGCMTPPLRIERLKALRITPDDAEFFWLPDNFSGGYRLYSVTDPLQIPDANGGNGNATLECDVPDTYCTVFGAVSDDLNPLIFYQVVGVCDGDPATEGPN